MYWEDKTSIEEALQYVIAQYCSSNDYGSQCKAEAIKGFLDEFRLYTEKGYWSWDVSLVEEGSTKNVKTAESVIPILQEPSKSEQSEME